MHQREMFISEIIDEYTVLLQAQRKADDNRETIVVHRHRFKEKCGTKCQSIHPAPEYMIHTYDITRDPAQH
jgi:hypothetical protein